MWLLGMVWYYTFVFWPFHYVTVQSSGIKTKTYIKWTHTQADEKNKPPIGPLKTSINRFLYVIGRFAFLFWVLVFVSHVFRLVCILNILTILTSIDRDREKTRTKRNNLFGKNIIFVVNVSTSNSFIVMRSVDALHTHAASFSIFPYLLIIFWITYILAF